ncbi:unnamed protein product [Cylicocyclus nassatus]|uniref:Uncharacterized protein n=1 Tax=Cylicocyclus nassatus TaxID=53992 RepID=A0AA36M775_CYLNA|nr:unnamed protein product [Cylicocyclus nassatus]
MHLALILLGVGCAFAQYDTQDSGYGNNNPSAVQIVANNSPRIQPVDYTSNNAGQTGGQGAGGRGSGTGTGGGGGGGTVNTNIIPTIPTVPTDSTTITTPRGPTERTAPTVPAAPTATTPSFPPSSPTSPPASTPSAAPEYNPFSAPVQAQSSPQAGGGGANTAPGRDTDEFGVVLTPVGGGSGSGADGTGSAQSGAGGSASSNTQGNDIGGGDAEDTGMQNGGYGRFSRYMMQVL